MNYIKLQQDILKAKFIEDTKGRRSPFMYGFMDQSICITEGHYMVIVPKCAFYLDLGKTFPKMIPLKLDLIRKIIYDAKPIQDTGLIRTVADGRKVRVFSGEKEEIWIGDDMFKYFDKDVTEYRGTDKRSPIFLYEYEVLVGVLYPVNHS